MGRACARSFHKHLDGIITEAPSSSVRHRTSFAMASHRLKRVTHLVLDFDSTLTVKDTMSVLGDIPASPKLSWNQISDDYTKDYNTYKNEPYPWKDYDRKEYSGWLEARRWVEARSAKRVEDAGFFRGVTLEDVKQTVARSLESGNLQLREGWVKLFELFLPDHDDTSGVIHGGGLSIDSLCRLINDMHIHANEIEGLCSPLGSSGRVCHPLNMDIRTSADKLRYMPPSRRMWGGVGPHVIYIGDSSTDFDALCAADVGIWLCDVPELQYGPTFKKMFEPLDFVPPPLVSWREHGTDKKHLFWWAPNFDVVLEHLGTSRQSTEQSGA
ncbi:uncharacterized protein MYCGRDRAFT_74145 [Zymoseptoria tritici IPO323]|uniref:Uncharacterized protein n=1 Tax=Zymoseptoria tritici (strain CBS 115943 / IPO323) TaxID=336722 RepID=F9XG44_ZYMTI|nr:uncharacterized protein MYCGRDRAFT_74145 [Zymoseptoria tritici IPO323]EGP86064.1 hypothetical protein MYCGRDRAFT_74145 [Zymoseptoria tritici IPO323]